MNLKIQFCLYLKTEGVFNQSKMLTTINVENDIFIDSFF